MFLQATWIVMSSTCTHKRDTQPQEQKWVEYWIFFFFSHCSHLRLNISAVAADSFWYLFFNSTFISPGLSIMKNRSMLLPAVPTPLFTLLYSWFKISPPTLPSCVLEGRIRGEMKWGDRHRWALFSSLSGKASQQACYWPHTPGEGVGQCNREQRTILDHLTIISKCTLVANSAGPPWERSFCSQLCLHFILLHRNLVMQIALLAPSLTTVKEAGGVLEHAAVLTWCLFQWSQLLSCVSGLNNL